MNTNIKIDFEMNKKKKDWLGSFYMETRSRQRPTSNFLAFFFPVSTSSLDGHFIEGYSYCSRNYCFVHWCSASKDQTKPKQTKEAEQAKQVRMF